MTNYKLLKKQIMSLSNALLILFAIAISGIDQGLAGQYSLLAPAEGAIPASYTTALSGSFRTNQSQDAYDPFIDYSEFEVATEEEADINFFRNGRFFTLGFMIGQKFLTGGLREVYTDAPTFGVYLNYFFDLRFALQLSFLTGSHGIAFSTENQDVSGTASITEFGVALKYYVNTQNVTKGLADLNPYLIGGFSQVFRTATVTDQEAFSKEGAIGINIGAGMEIPMLRNQMFFGIQGMYQLVNFKDENSEIILAGDERTGIFPAGDFFTFIVVLGINF